MESFKDKIVIITGGASGIGRALGKELAARGAQVVLADINQSLLLKTVTDLKNSGYKAEPVVADVSKFEEVKKLVDDTVLKHGRLDFIFNNAGIGIVGEVRDCSYDDWRKVIDVNLYGVVHGVVAAYPVMVKQGFGHIINTASLSGLIPSTGVISYTASKYGIVGLSHALRIEGADLGVNVSVVCPGIIDTPILQTSKVIKFDRKQFIENLPGLMTPEHCANVILRGVAQNKAIIVVTFLAKLLWLLQRLSPGFMLWFVGRVTKRARKMLQEGSASDVPNLL